MSAKEPVGKGHAGLVRSKHRASDPPMLGRKSVLMGMLTSGFVIANAAQPSATAAGTVKPGAIAATTPTYLTKWAASQAYVRGQQVVSPNNDVVSANVAHTSGSTFNAANWSVSSTYAAPEAYVAAPTGVLATDTANILAAVNKLPTTGDTLGGIVVLRAGLYEATLPALSNIIYRGQGIRRTKVHCSTGSMLTPVAGADTLFMRFEQLTLSTSGSHLIELGTTGYLAMSAFRDCDLQSLVATASIVHGTGSCGWQEVTMENCYLTMTSTATVSAFDIRSDISGIGSNTWKDCRAQGNNNNIVPFWYIEATAGSCRGNSWKQITSEGNQGGIIKILSPSGLTIEDVIDFDSTLYTGSIVEIGKSASGVAPAKIRLSNVGLSGPPGCDVNISHVNFTTAPVDQPILDRIGDGSSVRKIAYPGGYDAMATNALIVETVNIVATSGAAQTIPAVTSSTISKITLTANCTLTFPTAASGKSFTLVLVQDGTGSRLVTWPATIVKWPGGTAPVLSTGINKIDYLTFTCTDGTNWAGFVSGKDVR